MIDVYAFSTPNSVKVPIALEEAGLDYRLHSVNVRAGEQKDERFLALNPNAKVPVLTDSHGPDGTPVTLSESAAILVYIAEKSGQLIPTSAAGRAEVFEQLFFHASALSPAFGNAGFFQKFAPEPISIAIDRFLGEANRVTDLLDRKLANQRFIVGEELSIADIAHFGWFWRAAFVGIDLGTRTNLSRWYNELAARPAFQRGMAKTEALAPA